MRQTTPRLRRSALFMPASNPRALGKAPSLDADVVILDLEDAVAAEAKPAARAAAAAFIDARPTGREVLLRVNAPGSAAFDADLALLADARPDAVLAPKLDGPDDVAALRRALDRVDPDGGVRLWVMIETPRAVLNALAIADAPCPRLDAFVLGTNDLAKTTGVALRPGRAELLPWLMNVVAAARAAGLDVLDSVYNAFDDADGLRAECDQGAACGMDGKTLIHPNQIAVCNAAFSPDAAEVGRARRIVAAFDEPAAAGKGALRIGGEMVERLHADIARALLARADAIAARARRGGDAER